ncbi:MAG: dihydrolipoyl dehydrogenase [Acholeplasmataceae bacterium]
MDAYDLIVIGGGPGGYHAAEQAAKRGFRTLLAEKRSLGGVCLNEGCIPSKAYLNSAKHFLHAKDTSFGVVAKDVVFDQKRALKHKNDVVRNLVSGVSYKLKKAGVEVRMETARIKGRNDDGFLVTIGDQDVLAKRMIVSTGSSPVLPPIEGLKEGLESGFVMTSREILDLETIPTSLAVIGAGFIGLEMAAYFSSIGSDVTVIEMLPTIGGGLDEEIMKSLKKSLERKEIRFHLDARVTAIGPNRITYRTGGTEHVQNCERVLLSVGRKPVIADLGLERLHVQVEQGAIRTDGQGRTNVENVYAIGDVNGRSLLAHTAYREAEVVVRTMSGERDEIRYDRVPSVIYTTPEVAVVGLTEEEAKAKGYDASSVKLPVAYSGRHIAESNDRDGFIKLVIDRKRNILLGAHVIANYGSEMMLFLSSMLDLEIDIEQLKRLVYPHPTVGELIKDAFFQS